MTRRAFLTCASQVVGSHRDHPSLDVLAMRSIDLVTEITNSTISLKDRFPGLHEFSARWETNYPRRRNKRVSTTRLQSAQARARQPLQVKAPLRVVKGTVQDCSNNQLPTPLLTNIFLEIFTPSWPRTNLLFTR